MLGYDMLFQRHPEVNYVELRTYRTCTHAVPYNPALFTELDGHIVCTAKEVTIIEEQDMPLMSYVDRNLIAHSVKSAANMFNGCTQMLTLNCRNWNVDCVSDFTSTFANCNSLVYLDMSQWKTFDLTVTDHMFENCYKLLTANVGNWYTKNLVSTNSMFYNCYNLRNVGEISRWNIDILYDARRMFKNNYNFINICDKVKWNVNSASLMQIDEMFTHEWPDWAVNLCIARSEH